ncbi:hypothetical protein SAMN05216292_2353 [Caldicellulosiruptor bescii]|nr:hypothetical protein SAMN05216292_2353 [Caldicellulosiruptor bescii]
MNNVKNYGISKYIILFFISNFITYSIIQLFSLRHLIVKLIVSSDIITGILIIFFCRKELKEVLSRKTNTRSNWRLTILMFIYGVCYSLAMLSFYTFLGIDKINVERGEISLEIAKFIYSNKLMGFLSICIIAPIIEEILFRGLIFRSLLKTNSLIMSVIISSAIFAFFHLNFKQGIIAFGLGLLSSVMYFYYGSIFYPIAIHMGHNSTVLLIAILIGTNFSNFFSLLMFFISLSLTVINTIIISCVKKRNLSTF